MFCHLMNSELAYATQLNLAYFDAAAVKDPFIRKLRDSLKDELKDSKVMETYVKLRTE